MDATTTVILLMLCVTLFALLAEKIKIPYPTMMVIGGLAICFVPHLNSFPIDPNLIFKLFLPPLLYGGAWQISWKEFWSARRAIFFLAVGLVFFTSAGMAVLAVLLLPGFTWATGFALGAILSPPDAIAVTALAKKLHLPRKVTTLLDGESLVNDASALVVLHFAVEAVKTGHFSLMQAAGQFVIVAAGGALLGLLLGRIVCSIHGKLNDPLVEITITFLTPYAAYLLGEEIGVSGVLATVAAGIYVSWLAPTILKPQVRLEARAVWDFMLFLLNGFVFVFVGLLLPSVLKTLPQLSTLQLIGYGLLTTAGLVFLRMAWVVPGTFLPWFLNAKARKKEKPPSIRRALLIGWTGMRGAVSLAAALTIPEFLSSPSHGAAATPEPAAPATLASIATRPAEFPNRGIIIFLTFFVILMTLVLQSLTLPAVVKFLKIQSGEDEADEEHEARLYSTKAALTYLKDLTESTDAFGDTGIELRTEYERRVIHLESGPTAMPISSVGIDTSAMDLHREVLSAERQAVLELRANQKISVETFQRLMSDIDAEELRLPGRH